MRKIAILHNFKNIINILVFQFIVIYNPTKLGSNRKSKRVGKTFKIL